MKGSETYDQYIQEKLESLPFPDEHESWKRMELLLKKDRKRRPLFFIPIGCLGILLLTAGSIYLFYSSTNKNHVQKTKSIAKKDPLSKSIINRGLKTRENATDTIVKNDPGILNEPARKSETYNREQKKGTITIYNHDKSRGIKSNKQESNNYPNHLDINLVEIGHHTDLMPHLIFPKPQLFSLLITRKDIVVIKNNSHETKTKHELVLGLGVVQQIPVNGQSFVPYGNDGRKLSVSDYLPYLYGTYKLNNFSIEGQFRYGAPNYVRKVVYNEQKLDSIATQTHSYRYTVQKTFYHQIQLGINYRIRKKVEIGTGLQYNFFKNAIVKRDYVLKDLVLNKETVISSYQLTERDDSFFTKQHIDLSFQINYQFKKINLGIKGGMPLSSLLNYQDASGALKQEKSWYLNLYLRVPILRSTGN